jgi:hypothetical protein
MTLWDDIQQLKSGERELRKFGLLVGGVLAGLGILMWLRGKGHFAYFLAPGVLLLAVGLVLPKGLKQVYVAWMALAMVLGLVVSNVILTLFFFLVITPVGLAARCLGKDFLRLKLDRQATTYWLPRERKTKTPAQYERQF